MRGNGEEIRGVKRVDLGCVWLRRLGVWLAFGQETWFGFCWNWALLNLGFHLDLDRLHFAAYRGTERINSIYLDGLSWRPSRLRSSVTAITCLVVDKSARSSDPGDRCGQQ